MKFISYLWIISLLPAISGAAPVAPEDSNPTAILYQFSSESSPIDAQAINRRSVIHRGNFGEDLNSKLPYLTSSHPHSPDPNHPITNSVNTFVKRGQEFSVEHNPPNHVSKSVDEKMSEFVETAMHMVRENAYRYLWVQHAIHTLTYAEKLYSDAHKVHVTPEKRESLLNQVHVDLESLKSGLNLEMKRLNDALVTESEKHKRCADTFDFLDRWRAKVEMYGVLYEHGRASTDELKHVLDAAETHWRQVEKDRSADTFSIKYIVQELKAQVDQWRTKQKGNSL